jgi:hypothetical protein
MEPAGLASLQTIVVLLVDRVRGRIISRLRREPQRRRRSRSARAASARLERVRRPAPPLAGARPGETPGAPIARGDAR